MQKSSQHVRACATGDGAICSKNKKIVPYHGTAPIVELARAYGLHPRLWLLISRGICTPEDWLDRFAAVDQSVNYMDFPRALLSRISRKSISAKLARTDLHVHINLVCWVINLLLDVLLRSIASPSIASPTGSSKYSITRKNTLRYSTTKRLTRYMNLLVSLR